MNKADLIIAIAAEADISQAAAERALNAFIHAVTQSLAAEEPVTLVGFGSFEVRYREGRLGRNPQTGESIPIAARNVPVFKPGKGLKHAVNP